MAAWWLAGFLLLCFTYFLPRFDDWDQNSRFDMALALVNTGSPIIDSYHWNTGDITYVNGHYYSIMAPGQALATVPAAWGVRSLATALSGSHVAASIGLKRTWQATFGYYVLLLYLACILTVALPAVGLVLLVFWFLGYFSQSIADRLIVSLVLGIGTMVFPYAQVLYSHVPAAALLFAGFVLVYVSAGARPPRGPISAWFGRNPGAAMVLAGLALGAAEVYEYPAAVVAVPIGLYGLYRHPFRHMVWLALGALPGILVVGGYDLLVYHNPFMSGYSAHSVLWKEKLGHGIGGSTWPPKPGALWGMTFSPYRGVFFLSPVLLAGLPGLVLWARRRDIESVLFATIPVLYLIAISLSPFWFAGSTVGPRYLIPTLPFLSVPVIFVLQSSRRAVIRPVVAALGVLSVVNVWLQTIGNGGFPKQTVHDPLFQTGIPGFLHDHLPLSVGAILLAPFHAGSTKTALVPLLCALAIWSFRAARRYQRSVGGDHPAATVQPPVEPSAA